MKKIYSGRYYFKLPPTSLKFLRVMKLSVLLTCILSVNLAASVYSQQARFDLDIKDQSIRDVLKTIENESLFRFFYNADFTDLDKKLTFSASDQSIDGLLSVVLDNTAVSYKVLDNNFIVITPKDLLQQNVVAGTVKDQDGEPLPGVNVVVTGTMVGTMTDINGRYSINVPAGSGSLTFSFVGMEPQDVVIGALTRIDVTMAELAIGLEEVIVVGYGTQKRSDITGTVASMPSDRLEMMPNLNIAQAIQGAIPGVMIQTTSAGAAPEELHSGKQ